MHVAASISVGQPTTATSSAAPAINGDLIEFQIMGASGLPVSAGLINGNGRIARMRFKGMATGQTIDTSKCAITMKRPGYNTSKVFSATNVTDVVAVLGEVRQPYPNVGLRISAVSGSDVDVYFFISSTAYKSDTVPTVTLSSGFYGTSNAITFSAGVNNSTLDYPMPQVAWHVQEPWKRMTSSGIAVEALVDHRFARSFQTVAVFEPYIHVGVTEYGSVAISSMSLSAFVTAPFRPSVFAGTIPLAGCPQGEAFQDARIYPWVGDAVWDTASFGSTWPCFDLPAGLPVNCDTDGSYAPVGAYVSHTGVQIGTPSIKPLGSLGNYATEGAYSSANAVATAGKTYNNSASRTRAHNDTAEIWALAGDGHLIDGLGSSMSGVSVGLGYFTLSREAGSNKATTGWTTTTTVGTTIKVPPLRFRLKDIQLTGGGTGQLQCLFRGVATAGAATGPLSATALQYIVVDQCDGTGANETANAAMIQQKGACWLHNCNLTNQGDDLYFSSAAFFSNFVAIHGGTHDNTTLATPGLAFASSISGAQFKQTGYFFAYDTTVQPVSLGIMLWCSNFDIENQTAKPLSVLQGTATLATERGMSFHGVSTRSTRVGFTTQGDVAPCQISSDFSGTDRPPVHNLNVSHMCVAGARMNIFYNEFSSSSYEKYGHFYGCAFHQKNSKADDSSAATAKDGNRMGVIAYKYGVDVVGVVSGDLSANGSVVSIGGGSWLGEVTPPGSEDNVGAANMWTTDTSILGTDVAANAMNWAPLAKLKNRLPSGYARVPYDRNGLAWRGNGTDAAGVESY